MKKFGLILGLLLGLSTAWADSSSVAPPALPLSIANGGCNSATGCIVATKITPVTISQTIPRATGVKTVVIECVGAGGGGGGVAGAAANYITSAGGGGGSYSRVAINSPAASYVVTIGPAGAAGSSGANSGGAGGDTSVVINGVTVCVGKGGSGGIFGSSSNFPQGTAGGVAGTGDFTSVGAPGGGSSSALITTVLNLSGVGGSSVFGGGGPAVNANNGGNAGTGCGGGGSGAVETNLASNQAGGAGFAGCVVITEYTNQ